MLSLYTNPGYREAALPERIGRRVTIAHVITLAIIAAMTFAAYSTLERAISVGRQTAAAVEATDRQRMLSQRIASLAAQYTLGNGGVRHDLRAAIHTFERTHWNLVSGDRRTGIASVASDAALKKIYFDGGNPLDAAATDYVTRARRIAAMPSADPSLAALTAPLFLAAQAPLLDDLDAAVRARKAHAEHELTTLGLAGAGFCGLILLGLLAATVGVFRPMALQIVRLTRDAQELAATATTDPLTGMLNKRSFQARGAIEIQKARRYGRPLSLLRIDADQLSAIEAAHGPGSGEAMLRALTSSIFDGTRISDLVARVDAEQFAVLLPETNAEGAELLAERLRHKICNLSVPIDDTSVSCTISVGVAAAEKDASFLWPTFKRADEAVYQAKARGRNRVVVATAA
jgi:diguanylate cyclase (GGDEF)-like protein